MAAIYGLTSTRDGKIRYVGKTGGAVSKRFRQHYLCGSSSLACVSKWLSKERWQGYDLGYAIIETCEFSALKDRETYWIDRILNLVNVNINVGGYSELITRDSKSHIALVENIYKSEVIENWNGLIGIRYYPWLGEWRAHFEPPAFRKEYRPDDLFVIGNHRWLGYNRSAPESAVGDRDLERQQYEQLAKQRFDWPADLEPKRPPRRWHRVASVQARKEPEYPPAE